MKQRGLLILVASYLVVRLRMAILNSPIKPRQVHRPSAILVIKQMTRLESSFWVFDENRSHCIAMNSRTQRVRIQALPELGVN